MKILIYEDDVNDFIRLKQYLEIFFNNKNTECIITRCSDSDYLFKHLSDYDIVFLDIEVYKENGIDIGIEIRKINTTIKIVITSAYNKYLVKGYKIKAESYLLKPINQLDLELELENLYKQYINDVAFFYEKNTHKKIYYKDIMFIESLDRKTYVHLCDHVITSTNPLNYWEDKIIGYSFSKSYKSYLVNLRFILEYKRNEVKLLDGTIIKISRNYYKSFENDYYSFLETLV
ncbi:MAG: LytTR family DNA-binding domain-containing protein [Erysipelotrichaceae bacterium]